MSFRTNHYSVRYQVSQLPPAGASMFEIHFRVMEVRPREEIDRLRNFADTHSLCSDLYMDSDCRTNLA